MEWELTVVDQHGRAVPVVVTAGPAATVGGLRRALGELSGTAPGHLYAGDRRLHPDQRLDAVGLVTGDSLAIGRPVVAPTVGAHQGVDPDAVTQPLGGAAAQTALQELAVVGGRDAGTAVPLWRAAVIGRTADCDITLDDPEVSRRHARVETSVDGGITVTDLGSRNGTGRGGFRLTGPTALADGDLVQVGETMVAVRQPEPPGAVLRREGSHQSFNRPPRIHRRTPAPEANVPAEPTKPQAFRFPLAAVLLPLLAAGIVYALMPSSAMYLIFLALSPVMILGNVIGDRRSGRQEYKKKQKEYTAELAALHERLAALVAAEEAETRRELPDPTAVVRIATAPTRRLFERRPGDDDFLRLRVGLHDRPAAIRLTGQGAADHPVPLVSSVPSTVDLPKVGVLGLAGPRRTTLALARALLTQAATLHAPHDLGLVLLSGRDAAGDWEPAGWLPHTLPHRPDLGCRRMIGTDADQAEARIAELRRIVDERRTEQRAALASGTPLGRRLVVLVDGARRMRTLTGLAELLIEGPAVGVYAICLDTAEADLPDECRATVVATSQSGTRVRVNQPGTGPDSEVLVDGLTDSGAAGVARALAPIRVLGARWGADGDLPESVRFLDLTGLGTDPTPAQVADHWSRQPGGRSTKVLLGIGPDGPVEIDLRRDGPHALVAGTSGSGKSELLQTLVTGLALGNAPDALNVVLVDYKGGSAFAECANLPHCVGMVTDLDGHLVGRALASLSAELRRREGILAAAGAKDIEDYWALTGGRLPRLVIVVDEFASLVEEVPDFVTGVVGIGMRGRSLGVHVVLATQRPGGVVNAEMRANLNLRVSLRVTSPAESTDVIEVPDAARISRRTPGRAYLRTGHSDLAVVQAARVGWPRVADAAPGRADDTVQVLPRRFIELGRQRPVAVRDDAAGHDGDTDLTVLVNAIGAAAQRFGAPAPAGPWLPPLAEQVTLAELEAVPGGALCVPIGLADQPRRQAQTTYPLDLATTGPVVVAGMARSGRSTVLRTLAAALAERTSPADAHLYVLDQGTSALAPLAALPHCGAYVTGDDTDRTGRLLALLDAEIGRRQRLLAAGGYGSLAEQRAAVAPAERLAYLVLLLDGYETFLSRYNETDAGRQVDVLDGLLRRGPAVGIVPVLSTDRSGFTNRVASAVGTRLVLRQAEVDDVAAYGLNPRQAPRQMPAGRLLVAPGALVGPDPLEVQVALLTPDADGVAQAAAVDRLASDLRHRWDGLDPAVLPHRIDPLPTSITLSELAELRLGPRPERPTVCTVGAGGDHLVPIDVDLAEAGAAFLVSGPPGSGRSTALAGIVGSLAGLTGGTLPVIAVCPRPSPLRALEGVPGVLGVLTGTEVAAELEELVARAGGPVAIAVDDAELLAEGPAGDVLEQLVRTARDSGGLVLAAGTTEDLQLARYRGWLAAARRSRCGLLLNPSSYVDGEVFDLKLPRSTCGGWPPGRGLLVLRGSTLAVQVPVLPGRDLHGTVLR